MPSHGDPAVDRTPDERSAQREFYDRFYRRRAGAGYALSSLLQVSEYLITHRVFALTKLYAGPSPRILDVGCGRGQVARRLTRIGRVCGTDLSEEAVRACRSVCPEGTFEVRDLWDDGWHRKNLAGYQAVVSTETIEHIPYDRQRAFVERLVALVEPRGILILTTPNREVIDLLPHDPALSTADYYRQFEGQPLADLLSLAELRELMPEELRILEHEEISPWIRPRPLDVALKTVALPTGYRLLGWMQRALGLRGKVQILCARRSRGNPGAAA